MSVKRRKHKNKQDFSITHGFNIFGFPNIFLISLFIYKPFQGSKSIWGTELCYVVMFVFFLFVIVLLLRHFGLASSSTTAQMYGQRSYRRCCSFTTRKEELKWRMTLPIFLHITDKAPFFLFIFLLDFICAWHSAVFRFDHLW